MDLPQTFQRVITIILSALKLPREVGTVTLSQLGIEVDRYGNMSVNEDMVKDAINNNLSDLKTDIC